MEAVGDLSAEVVCVGDSLRSIDLHEKDVRLPGKADYAVTVKRLAYLLANIDASRCKAHEELEAETIAASVLRHKLGIFEQRLQVELEDAAHAVKLSTLFQKEYLQVCTSNVKAATTQTERRYTALEHQTDRLMKQLQIERGSCTDLIEDVNGLMTSRAKLKIALNTTQDMLHLLLSKAQRCEKDTEHIEKQNNDGCKKFEVDINHLYTALESIQRKIFNYHKQVEYLTRELDVIMEDVVRAAGEKAIVQQSLSDYDLEIHHILQRKRLLHINAKRDVEQTQELTETRAEFLISNQVVRDYFHCENKWLMEQQHMILRGAKEIEQNTCAMGRERRSLQAVLQRETEAKDKHQSSIASLQKRSGDTKKTLLSQSERGATLQGDNKEFEYRLKECTDIHKVTCGQYKDQIQILKQSFEDEECVRRKKEEKMAEIVLRNVSLHCELTSQAINLSTYEERSTYDYTASLQKLSVLRHLSKRLEEHQLSLKNEFFMNSTKLKSTAEKMESQSQQLEEQIAVLEGDLMNILVSLDALKPRCTSLEEMKHSQSSVYNKEKENIISNKSQRNGLQDKFKLLQGKLKSINKLQELLRMEVVEQRAHARSQVQCQTVYVHNCEHEVAKAKWELKAVDKQNAWICEVIGALKLQCSRAKRHCRKVKQYCLEKKVALELQWTVDNVIEKEYAVYYEGIFKRITVLSTLAQERKEKVSNVFSKMKLETFMV